MHIPVGYLFLQATLSEPVPIPDFRTVDNAFIKQPSPDLLDTIYICQQRQEWYRDYARSVGEPACPFVGVATQREDVASVAQHIREVLGFDLDARHHMRTWTEALRAFIEQADEAGIMIMVSGVVANNNRRKLDPDEFRGFVLSDSLAPLIFINGADTKSAQMFTLAHEIAHVWLGTTGLSDVEPMPGTIRNSTEQWCNAVAAEMLVPLDALKKIYRAENLTSEVSRLAHQFKVSTLVILRRIYDAGCLTRGNFLVAYRKEQERLMKIPRGRGGNFYFTHAARVSKRFATAVISSALEGRASFTESLHMLGIKKMKTFLELGHNLGVVP